ncbi:hypothetical protein P152DRAFT_473324 [Eremomyces bilateralis CBS 781.70]|uniref:DUF7626 domain-containing protein n=1 Tax=Eremomyces bilateralis CBS 781.70 TaxID=1392243 RepID=A0A6G1G3U1_9PEZI|nr:uncharacterized protein P152DRAFT_473324 [Eremomyces bilateralis CBS 781.70]KAF1812777.1 hypothetical protein P152DRAFT_473324 [Eremomyces bilateralis CBS 781.70]
MGTRLIIDADGNITFSDVVGELSDGEIARRFGQLEGPSTRSWARRHSRSIGKEQSISRVEGDRLAPTNSQRRSKTKVVTPPKPQYRKSDSPDDRSSPSDPADEEYTPETERRELRGRQRRSYRLSLEKKSDEFSSEESVLSGATDDGPEVLSHYVEKISPTPSSVPSIDEEYRPSRSKAKVKHNLDTSDLSVGSDRSPVLSIIDDIDHHSGNSEGTISPERFPSPPSIDEDTYHQYTSRHHPPAEITDREEYHRQVHEALEIISPTPEMLATRTTLGDTPRASTAMFVFPLSDDEQDGREGVSESRRRHRAKSTQATFKNPIAADLDIFDKTLIEMKLHGYSEDAMRAKIVELGGIKYEPKSITSRFFRLKQKLDARKDEELKCGADGWHAGEDEVLIQAYRNADAEIEEEHIRLEEKRWKFVQDHFTRIQPKSIYSEKALKDHFVALIADEAEPSVELSEDPEHRKTEMAESKAKLLARKEEREDERRKASVRNKVKAYESSNTKLKQLERESARVEMLRKREEKKAKRAAKDAVKEARSRQRIHAAETKRICEEELQRKPAKLAERGPETRRQASVDTTAVSGTTEERPYRDFFRGVKRPRDWSPISPMDVYPRPTF